MYTREYMKRLSLRQLNNALTAVLVCLCLYLIVAPLWPLLSFWWQREHGSKPPLVVANQSPTSRPEPIPAENTLVIPKILLQQTIHEGKSPYPALNKGLWRYPKGSNPALAGNTVISGHRFTYGGPAVLYHLDKIAVDDAIFIYWEKQKHEYRVEEISIVPPGATEIQAPTPEPTLTIYTCTPLVTAKNRLVIRAKLVSEVTP